MCLLGRSKSSQVENEDKSPHYMTPFVQCGWKRQSIGTRQEIVCWGLRVVGWEREGKRQVSPDEGIGPYYPGVMATEPTTEDRIMEWSTHASSREWGQAGGVDLNTN